ncbi:peptide/nickel transport system permease protein [Arthrobacter subterraneus]|uniref:Peptide/nickel transport system permease protein n=1 Tax=Arthrobacter subterraneus TaxID=335973 RepID=A0A1G8IK94_9MICC|nr:ABC transporter permease [Arthrobacter subterraneus]SDI19207.1 peptide/nickel transport system permease protein [Arthrobacter subterraneus]
MLNYLATRLWQSIVTLILASMVVFFGVRQLPGDPALAMAGEEATPERLAAIREQLGLNESIITQYVKFVGNMVRGDFGQSTRTGAQVTDLVAATLPVTLWLSAYAIVVAVIVGVLLGVIAERFRGRWPEWMANALALIGLSVPNFWLGILAILYLAVAFGLFPASGYVPISRDPFQGIYHLTLPAIILGTSLAAVIMRQTRASMIETMKTDFVRTARAKGLSRPRVLFRYGLRNSLIVVVTIIGLQLGGLISGAVVTERIFALPGFGKLTLDAVFTRDYPVIQAVVLLITVGYILINLAVDILYSVINPRIRVGGKS